MVAKELNKSHNIMLITFNIMSPLVYNYYRTFDLNYHVYHLF